VPGADEPELVGRSKGEEQEVRKVPGGSHAPDAFQGSFRQVPEWAGGKMEGRRAGLPQGVEPGRVAAGTALTVMLLVAGRSGEIHGSSLLNSVGSKRRRRKGQPQW